MDKEQIIERIWELPWYDVMYIALADDWILFVKLWPVWALLFSIILGFLLYNKIT
jgi:hypothetical protein